MSIDQIFPTNLLDPARRTDFLQLLLSLSLTPRRTKQIYFEYLRITSQAHDLKEIQKILGENNATIPQ